MNIVYIISSYLLLILKRSPILKSRKPGYPLGKCFSGKLRTAAELLIVVIIEFSRFTKDLLMTLPKSFNVFLIHFPWLIVFEDKGREGSERLDGREVGHSFPNSVCFLSTSFVHQF